MRKYLIPAGLIIALSACGPQSARTSLVEANIALYTPSQSEIVMITEAVRGKLKDPTSAIFNRLYMSRDLDKDRMYYFCGTLNAKNSYGGYTGDKYYWGSLIKDGEKAAAVVIGVGGNKHEQTAIFEMCRRQVLHILN